VKEKSSKIVGKEKKASMGSSSLFKFTKVEVEVENIIQLEQRKHLMAYLKITSM